jgi:RimJ/RimL family protein N-acetyltransferase
MAMVLETARLRLRPFGEGDGGLLYELNADPEVTRYINGGKATPRVEIEVTVLPAMRRVRTYPDTAAPGYWAAEERDGGAFVGWFGLPPDLDADASGRTGELGYRLRRAAWGQGYATEGAQALVERGFRGFGLHRITAYTMTVNAGSRRVMEKCGLRYVRTYFQDWPEVIDGGEHGDVEYAVTREAWEAARG